MLGQPTDATAGFVDARFRRDHVRRRVRRNHAAAGAVQSGAIRDEAERHRGSIRRAHDRWRLGFPKIVDGYRQLRVFGFRAGLRHVSEWRGLLEGSVQTKLESPPSEVAAERSLFFLAAQD